MGDLRSRRPTGLAPFDRRSPVLGHVVPGRPAGSPSWALTLFWDTGTVQRTRN
jgi:hypothetical protein